MTTTRLIILFILLTIYYRLGQTKYIDDGKLFFYMSLVYCASLFIADIMKNFNYWK